MTKKGGSASFLHNGLVVLVLAFAAAPAVEASTFCVDAARGRVGATGACNIHPDGYWADPYRTLGEALGATGAGDILWVAEGLYREDDVVVPNGVVALGGFAGWETDASLADPAAHPTHLQPRSAPGADTVVLRLSREAHVEGLRVSSTDPTHGAAVQTICPVEPAEAEFTIRNNEIHASDVGIRIPPCERGGWRTADLVTISRNRIHGNRVGVLASGPVTYPPADGLILQLSENVFFRNRQQAVSALSMTEQLDVSLWGDLLAENETGLKLALDQTSWGFAADLDAENTIGVRNRGSAYRVDWHTLGYYQDISFRRNTLVGNQVNAINFATDNASGLNIIGNFVAAQGQSGIWIHSSSDGVPPLLVAGNRILANRAAGVEIAGPYWPDALFHRNDIIMNGRGLKVHERFADWPYSFVIGGTPVNRNDLSRNTEYGVGCLSEPHELSAEWNYWGFNTDAEVAACVHGPVDYAPWYWPPSGRREDGAPRQIRVYPAFASYLSIPLDRPATGSRVTVAWMVDTANSGASLGSFEGLLRWDPWVMSYVDWQPGAAGFEVLCEQDAVRDGYLRCFGDRAEGARGSLTLVCVTFDVPGGIRWYSPVDLEWSSLVSNATSIPPFEDLRPIARERDDYLRVAPMAIFGDVLYDGEVDSADARTVLSFEVGLPIPPESAERIEEHLADANGDGVTNSTDANIMASYEVRLNTPRPVGETNVIAAPDCSSPLGDDSGQSPPGSGPPESDLRTWLVLLGGPGMPGQAVRAEIWLENGSGLPVGSYTAELHWPAGRYHVLDVTTNQAEALGAPRFNDALGGEGRLPFAAASPAGEDATVWRLLMVTLEVAEGAGDPVQELTHSFHALATVSPGFESMMGRLRYGPPVVRRETQSVP